MNCTFTSRWRISACAHTFVSTSVTVMRTSGSRSRSLATSAFARVMSARRLSWNTGTVHACVRRRAIVLRTFESGTRSTSPVGAGAGATDGGAVGPPASARSTSSATMRPSGPVPRICRELDAALARDPPRERRRLDPPVRRTRSPPAAAPPAPARAPARSCCRRPPSARRGSRVLGNVLALVADERRSSSRPRPRPRRSRSSAGRRTPRPRPPASPCRCRARRAARPSRPARPPT